MTLKMNSTKWAAVEYVLNRFCPYGIISFLIFVQFGFYSFQPYAIMGLIWFLEKYSFSVGHSVGRFECDPEYREEVNKEIEKDMEE